MSLIEAVPDMHSLPPGQADYYLTPPTADPETINRDGTLRYFAPTEIQDPDSEPALMVRDYLDVRHKFVQEKGWLPDASDDVDYYDTTPATTYFLRSNPENPTEVLGGMRLTRVTDVQSSLSWHMMDRNPAMQAAVLQDEVALARIKRAAAQGDLYDLTRLVLATDGRIHSSPRDISVDTWGAGIAATADSGKDTAWIFMAEEGLAKLLSNLGAPYYVLASGEVTPGDEEQGHFCVVYPQEVLDQTQDSERRNQQYLYNRLTGARDSF